MAASGSEKQIAADVAKAGGVSISKLGLRFDRVVVRVLGDLTRFAERAMPTGMTVLVAISAPIRLPAKTVSALEADIDALISGGPVGQDRGGVLCGNDVTLRLVEHPSRRTHKLVGFVHNRGVDATQLLNLAEAWLRSEARPPEA